jgi:hypothetical protein
MTETRTCALCGTVFEPRREHARFCSVTALQDSGQRLGQAAEVSPAARRGAEGVFTGLRFVRNWMGYHLDPADFIELPKDGATGGTPVATWTWRSVPAPDCASLPPRGRSWETARHKHYRLYLVGQQVGETITHATTFLTQLAPAA